MEFNVHGPIIPPFIEAAVGSLAYQFSFDAAEAVYRSQNVSPVTRWVEELLHHQTSGTSFGAPLLLMGATDAGLILGQTWLTTHHHAKEADLLSVARILAPLAVAAIFIGWEIVQMKVSPGYIDNHGADIFATLCAVIVAEAVVLSNWNVTTLATISSAEYPG